MERLTEQQAVEKLKEWAAFLDINTNTEEFKAAQDVLVMPVVSNRLAFDLDTETFKLRLAAPIQLETSKRETLDIKELTLAEKRILQKYKDSEKIDMVEAIYAASAGLTRAEASRIKGRDFTVISAINSVFFS